MNKSETAPIIIGKLMHIGGMLERHGNKLLLPFGLNQQQFSIFFEIGKAGEVKQKDMVNRLSLERAHVSKVIKKLQNMELIDSTESEDDKRSSLFSLTQKGKIVLNECREVFKKWNQQWIVEIDEDQHGLIVDHLTKLQDVFKEAVNKSDCS
jgi:MarR family transcriptional regulator, transcriptional regulator for hemolysin